MLGYIMQMRFVTFLLMAGCSILFLLCFLYWDTPTMSEREFELKASTAASPSPSLARRPVPSPAPTPAPSPAPAPVPHTRARIKSRSRRFKMIYEEHGVKVILSGRRAKPRRWKKRKDLIRPPVLLFHDTKQKKTSSKMWDRLGTIKLLKELGHRVIAINMPGYGRTRIKGHLSGAEFTASVLKHLKLKRCILIVPGMSSSYAFPYLFDEPETARKRIAALVAIGTPHAEAYSDQQFRNLKDMPTLYIQGENDDISRHVPLNRFKEAPNGEVQIVPHAGYRVYKQQTEEFHRYLTHFIKKLHEKK